MKNSKSRLEQMAARPPRLTFWELKEMMANLFKAAIIYYALTNHVSDGSIWAIYYEAPRGAMVIGDFWAAVIIILLIRNIYGSLRRSWRWL